MQLQGIGNSFLAGRIWALSAELQLDKNRLVLMEQNLQGLYQQMANPNTPSSSAALPILSGLPEASDPTFYRSEALAIRKNNLLVSTL